MPRITAKRKERKDKDGKAVPGYSVAANIDFGENLAATVAKFGEGVVHKQAVAAMTVAFQGWLRSQGAQGKKADEIQKAADAWKPGERKASKSPAEKLRELLGNMSAEDRAAVLKDYKAKAA